ncbi:alpha/beta hydrolase [Oryzobacter telluris]|uniref:alpha/beta hydrolase n=1 Tax=Oryzobacter telluris TaxID=3149179 RepID=UPI00370CFF74
MTLAFVDSATARVRASTWLPVLGRAEHVFDRALSGVGLTCATWAFAASLVPSLLPRAGWLQGVVSGVTVAVGYGFGAGAHALWDYLGIPGLRGRVRTVLITVLVGLGLLGAVLNAWRLVGWQNDIRRTFGMEPTSPTIWPVIVVVTLLLSTALLFLGRGIRLLARRTVRSLARRLPPRLSLVLGILLLVTVFWGLWTGVIVRGFFAGANATFAPQDTIGTYSTARPSVPERSGTAGSLARWEGLGRYGRVFVRGGPTVAQLEEVNGVGAKQPIRVFAGLQSAPTVQGRADLILAELKRTGAFDRKVLVIATTTGMGLLDRHATNSLEYAWNGDTAIAGVQYSYLPSWISLLADQEAVVESSRVVFETVRDYWATLPATQRPRLYLYGLSLGAKGVEGVLSSVNILNASVDGALMVGPPFVNDLHARLVAGRDPGSSATLPVYEGGRTVRFMDEHGAPQQTPGPWGPTRVVYLQHASDPVSFFSTDLAFERPSWLADDERGPDVSERMGWFPVVTMWQVLLDMPGAGAVPDGYGHQYSYESNLRAWAAVTEPPNWTPERQAAILAALNRRG